MRRRSAARLQTSPSFCNLPVTTSSLVPSNTPRLRLDAAPAFTCVAIQGSFPFRCLTARQWPRRLPSGIQWSDRRAIPSQYRSARRCVARGFHALQIRVAQHYSEQCGYPIAPQLWTHISLRESCFVVTASPANLAPRLDRLSSMFDKAMFAEAPPANVLAAAALRGDVLRAAGLGGAGPGAPL
ncbi:MAG: hypothetical protein EON54_06415 [Alcaligenaceae bacterium]|nr:MAG: hypothetical protein EON54_06415 [Alcaligenaceae bacterium]